MTIIRSRRCNYSRTASFMTSVDHAALQQMKIGELAVGIVQNHFHRCAGRLAPTAPAFGGFMFEAVWKIDALAVFIDRNGI